MKINIQKIAYRAIPVLTAFVVLFSSVVVGNPLKANALGQLEDYDKNKYSNVIYYDTAVHFLDPWDLFYVNADGSTFECSFNGHNYFDVTAVSDLEIVWYFGSRHFKSSADMGNHCDFIINTSLSQSPSAVGYPLLHTNFVELTYYNDSRVVLGRQEIHCNDLSDPEQYGTYSGSLFWPDGATHFDVTLRLKYDVSDVEGQWYFYRESDFSDVDVPRFKTYNTHRYYGVDVYWNLPRNIPDGADAFSWLQLDLLTQSPKYKLDVSSSASSVSNSYSFSAYNFSYVFDPDEQLRIEYSPNVRFDVNELLAVNAKVNLDDMKGWLVGSSEGDCDYTPPVLLIDYYDTYGNKLSTQEVSCNCVSEDWSNYHIYDFYFVYPENVKYLEIRAVWKLKSYDSVGFFIGLDWFYMSVYRDCERFESYMSGNSDGGYVVPDFPAGDGPDVNSDSVDMGNLVDSDAVLAVTSPIVALWECSVLNSALLIVVALCLVSWVFFGKKG